ncbi:MAG: glycine betaine ABC transporter substrate-binding protein [Acidimicrobiia bacterium]|nr:glycine betaine ABC transporter substrate-binding protein [Acidimicrobiia bacterium]
MSHRVRGRDRLMVAVAALAVLTVACGGATDEDPSAQPGAIRIAAFNFPESELIAEIYAQALEARGFPVERLS